MYVIPYSSALYQRVSALWTANNWPIVPAHALPITGRVIMDKDQLVAAGFIYLSNSSIAWLEFVVTNPKAPQRLAIRP
jgi:hypothetical protein